jgi:hypothetical protein
MKTANGTDWLADLPAHAVLDCTARLDGRELRHMVITMKVNNSGSVLENPNADAPPVWLSAWALRCSICGPK